MVHVKCRGAAVVKEGSMGHSPKASHTALPRPKCPILPSLEGNMGHFVPYCPPWRVIWDGRPILPSLEGNMGRPSRTRKEGGGEANLVSGRAIWDAFDQNCSKMADFFRHFESLFFLIAGKRGCGLRLFHSDFRLVSCGLRLFFGLQDLQANGIVDLDFFGLQDLQANGIVDLDFFTDIFLQDLQANRLWT